MNVEHENFLLSMFLSVQRRRTLAGNMRCIACAKSALITTESASSRSSIACATPFCFAAVEIDLFDRFIEKDLDALVTRYARHRARDRAAPANGMEDAVLILQEAERMLNRLGQRERRHAKILGLEAEARGGCARPSK